MGQLTSHPVSRIQGEYIPPGDKSISHRLAMLGALASGRSEFSHFLEADDCLRTLRAFRAMGVSCDLRPEETKTGARTAKLIVNGVGLKGLSQPKAELDLGNSGTTMRLLMGILAGQPFETRLTGDASLLKRPMRRVTEPLQKMGARISGRAQGNYAPITIRGGSLKGIQWHNKIGSAQVKSAILLAGLYAEGATSVYESIPSRDHTERLLPLFGVPVEISHGKAAVRKAGELQAVQIEVPGDFSSAAFFVAAALLVPASNLRILNVGLNPTRTGFCQVLRSMGADIRVESSQVQGEPLGNLCVKHSRLKGIELDPKLIPLMIDEIPILMVLCALAEGTSVIRGAEELRVKETDRIHSMVEGLQAIGANVREREDGCVIEGVRKLKGGVVSSYQDHRTAMSFAIAGLASQDGVLVGGSDCIGISYPEFEADLRRVCRI